MKTKYTVKHRRKREGRTDYKKRLELLKSRDNRIVIRKTNTQIIIQFIKYSPEGDQVILTYKSSNLKEKGWKHSYKSIPAAYLAGLEAGNQAQKNKIKTAVLDIGLQRPHKGSRLYAALKGIKDTGVEVPAGEKVFPTEERLNGKHISEKVAEDFKKLESTIK